MGFRVDNNATPPPRTDAKGPAPTQGDKPITGAQARATQEGAFDKTFNALTNLAGEVGTAAAGAMTLMPEAPILSPEANIAQALPILADCEAKYLQDAPKGPMGESFSFAKTETTTTADTSEPVPAPSTSNANDIVPKAEPGQSPELADALSAADDQVWAQALKKIPTPTDPAAQSALAVLRSPEGQKILAQLGPILKQAVGEASGGVKKLTDADKKKAAELLLKLKDSSLADADVESLVMLVLMEIHQDRGHDIRDLLHEMREDNQKKKAMREQIRGYKQHMAEIETQANDAYKAGLADGTVKPGTTFDDYLKTVKVEYPFQADDDGNWPPPRLSTGTEEAPGKLESNFKWGGFDELKEQIGGLQDKMDAMGDLSMEKQQRMQMYMEPYNQTSAMLSNIMKKIGETVGNMVQNLK